MTTLTISPNVSHALVQGKTLAYDGVKQTVKVSNRYDKKEAVKVLDVLLKALQGMNGATDPKTLDSRQVEVLKTAGLYLNALAERYKKDLDKGLTACKSHPLLMKISKLDRYVLSINLRMAYDPAIHSLEGRKVEQLYKTQVSRDLLQKWIEEPTHTARKKDGPEKVIPLAARDVFCYHPADVDFITRAFLLKNAARHDEQILVDPNTKHAQIKFDGTYRSVDKIQELVGFDDVEVGDKGKLFSKEGHKRYFYREGQGLTPFDPVNWKELPVFRARKHAEGPDDYRLVIKSIINKEDDDKHTWPELKSPTDVYNVGYFWDDRDSIQLTSLLKTLRGRFHVGDRNEYIGGEKHILKTVCKITKEQFDALKKDIEASQNSAKPKMFNMINSSCTSWMRRLMATVGVDISSKVTASRVVMGKTYVPTFAPNTLLGKVEQVWHNFLAVVRNAVIYFLFSGGNSVLPRKAIDPSDLALPAFLDIFKPEKGLPDYPERVREWQLHVAAVREQQAAAVRNQPGFSGLSEANKKAAVEKVTFALPLGIALPKVAMTF